MKKLLLTIIILGACLVGSSQNWDSVRVGNIDVDSIMLGGAKIWEKATTVNSFYFTTNDINQFNASDHLSFGSEQPDLTWIVSGVVVDTSIATFPIFDFATIGEKKITVIGDLTYLNFNYDSISSINVNECKLITELDLFNMPISDLNISKLNRLTSLTIYNLPILELNISLNLSLENIYLLSPTMQTSGINKILDDLISLNKQSTGYCYLLPACGDLTKITALDAIWGYVEVDACQ